MALLSVGPKRAGAAAIANARGGRRGMPAITNILDVLPQKLRDEVMEDAEAVLEAVGFADVVKQLRSVAVENNIRGFLDPNVSLAIDAVLKKAVG